MADKQYDDRRYYSLTDPGDSEPWALMSVCNGVYERWVPGHGWVDAPALAAYMYDDPGATEITAEQAAKLQEAGIGPLSDAAVEAIRGRP
jgi:hypothetical protein